MKEKITETEHQITEENKQQQQQQDRLLTKVDSLSQLIEHLHEKIIGHDVAEPVFRSRTGRSRQNQPIGSFLFLAE